MTDWETIRLPHGLSKMMGGSGDGRGGYGGDIYSKNSGSYSSMGGAGGIQSIMNIAKMFM